MVPITKADATARGKTRQAGLGSRLVATLAIAVLTTTTPGSTSQAPPDDAYARVVEAYSTDERADIGGLLQLTQDDVRRQAQAAAGRWVADLRAAEGTPLAASARLDAIRRLQAAALLPLELALSISTRYVVHSHLEAFEDAAREAFERLPAVERPVAGAGVDRRVDRTRLEQFRLWWRLGYLQFLANVGRHGEFARLAAAIRPGPGGARAIAEYQLLRGMVDEHSGRMALRTVVQAGRTSFDPGVTGLMMSLESASSAYRRALEAMPDHQEARLRLGRTFLDRKRPDQAIATLAPLLAPACKTTTCALAALFTGEAHVGRGALDDAARAYAQASSQAPVRQSALLALIHVAALRGDPAPGAPLLGHFAETAPLARTDQPDAWSSYMSGRRQHLDGVLAPAHEVRLR